MYGFDEVLVIDPNGIVIGSGSARKSGSEMIGTRGPAVKLRWASDPSDEVLKSPKKGSKGDWSEIWENVVRINEKLLNTMIGRAVSFIRRVIGERDIPHAVSFSGGKDSLATLLLVMEAGFKPPILFVDTGIEFPETVSYVRDIAGLYELELVEDAIAGSTQYIDYARKKLNDDYWAEVIRQMITVLYG